MTFKEYVRTARLSENARGDFLIDARSDGDMPDDFASWDELRAYLTNRHHACDGAIEGAQAAWRGYQVAKRKAPTEAAATAARRKQVSQVLSDYRSGILDGIEDAIDALEAIYIPPTIPLLATSAGGAITVEALAGRKDPR